jgi:ABC-type sulfate transport system permease subunit
MAVPLPRVKSSSRVLAGLLALFSFFGNAVGLSHWFQVQTLEFTFTFPGLLLVLGSLVIGTIFLFVAISGRDPMGFLLVRAGSVDER